MTFTSVKSFILQAHGKDLNVIMLSVVMLNVMVSNQLNRFLQEAQADMTGTSVRSFILHTHGKDLNVVMLSGVMLSVMAQARSLPFQQIPTRGYSQINYYVCKKFYITGPWKGSECRYAECHYADCHGAG